MGIFSSIKRAIFGKEEKPQTAAPDSMPAPTPATGFGDGSRDEHMATVDVENTLDSMPGADRLNWRTSIVDLMKLIGVDSDYESRKALARELGREDYSDSAEDNVWLHKRTMRGLADNGGRVPSHFLD